MKVIYHRYKVIKDKDLGPNQVLGSYGWSKDVYYGTLYGINTVVEADETISVAIIVSEDRSIEQIPIGQVTSAEENSS